MQGRIKTFVISLWSHKFLSNYSRALSWRIFELTIFKTKDGTQIYYKDWGSEQPVVFSHGWPLSADAFEDQMFYPASRGSYISGSNSHNAVLLLSGRRTIRPGLASQS